ncbi:hypothetical protein ACWOFB_01225 [Enterococcus hermanniensis]
MKRAKRIFLFLINSIENCLEHSVTYDRLEHKIEKKGADFIAKMP